MMRILTKEEAEKSDKEVDAFLLALDYNTKHRIKRLLETMIAQANCEHKWIDPNTYENDLDKTKMFCQRCDITRHIYTYLK